MIQLNNTNNVCTYFGKASHVILKQNFLEPLNWFNKPGSMKNGKVFTEETIRQIRQINVYRHVSTVLELRGSTEKVHFLSTYV